MKPKNKKKYVKPEIREERYVLTVEAWVTQTSQETLQRVFQEAQTLPWSKVFAPLARRSRTAMWINPIPKK